MNALASLIGLGLALALAPDATLVELRQGKIRGIQSAAKDGVRAWIGIPFAAPPMGALRWKPPEPAAKWEGVRACEVFGPSCPQPFSPLGVFGGGAGEQSEDCLHLNVWSPATSPDAKLAVLVWIHGGGFFQGSSSGRAYHGGELAKKGVVVVTINYRLGPLGFLGHPALTKESPERSSGNYGLLDQIAALRWVQDEIAKFGGDPGNVTIFGESAGAMSVGCLLVSPLAKGLFHRAIAQSGAAIWIGRRLAARGFQEEAMEAMGTQVIRELVGDAEDPIAAARAKSAEEVLATSRPGLRVSLGSDERVYGPIVDGWVIPDDPWKLFAEGKAAKVPFLAGTVADEGTMFTRGARGTPEQGERAMKLTYGEWADDLIDWYSSERFGEDGRATAEMVGDLIFVAPTRAQVRALAQSGARCFLYQFTRLSSGRRGPLGVFHASDIDYVFGHLEGGLLARYDAGDRKLSSTMMDYWVQFARTGDPNRQDLPPWPEYVEEEDPHLELGSEVKACGGLKSEACDLWDRIQAGWRAAAHR